MNMSREENEAIVIAERKARLAKMTVPEIIALIESREYDVGHHVIILSQRATLEECGWTLFDVVEDDAVGYIPRFHAAQRLAMMMDLSDARIKDVIDAASDKHDRKPFVAALRAELVRRIGPRLTLVPN